jgi:hypothetical protein
MGLTAIAMATDSTTETPKTSQSSSPRSALATITVKINAWIWSPPLCITLLYYNSLRLRVTTNFTEL